MESGEISDLQIKSSSQFDSIHAAIYGRLHLVEAPGSHRGVWSSATADASQWLQVDLGNHASSTITRVATQGGNDFHKQWVTKYKLQHSNDGISFQYYRELGQTTHKARYTESTLVSHHVAKPASRLCHVMLKVLTGSSETKTNDKFSSLLRMSGSSATPFYHIRKSRRGCYIFCSYYSVPPVWFAGLRTRAHAGLESQGTKTKPP